MSKRISVGLTTIVDVDGVRKILYEYGTHHLEISTEEDWDDFVLAVTFADKRLKWETKE